MAICQWAKVAPVRPRPERIISDFPTIYEKALKDLQDGR